MRYRIKETDEYYYPQRKILGIWFNYINTDDMLTFYVKFTGLRAALNYIKDKVTKPKITIHEVEL